MKENTKPLPWSLMCTKSLPWSLTRSMEVAQVIIWGIITGVAPIWKISIGKNIVKFWKMRNLIHYSVSIVPSSSNEGEKRTFSEKEKLWKLALTYSQRMAKFSSSKWKYIMKKLVLQHEEEKKNNRQSRNVHVGKNRS